MRSAHIKINVSEYAALLERACPAGVYEYVDVEGDNVEGSEEGGGWEGKKLVINFQVLCIPCFLLLFGQFNVLTPLSLTELHSLQTMRHQSPHT